MQETRVRSLDWEDPNLEEEMQPTPVFSPGKSHGQRSLEGYGPWSHGIRHYWVTSTFTFNTHLLMAQWGSCHVTKGDNTEWPKV